MRVWHIAVVYGVGSIAALFFGRPLIEAVLPLGDVAFTIVFCILGPLALMAHALLGTGYSSMSELSLLMPAVLVYAVTTLLLVFCLFLARRKSRTARLAGYTVAAIIWIGSGYLTMLAVTEA